MKEENNKNITPNNETANVTTQVKSEPVQNAVNVAPVTPEVQNSNVNTEENKLASPTSTEATPPTPTEATQPAPTVEQKSVPASSQKEETNTKSNTSIFFIFGIMILFVVCLPFITSYIEGNDSMPVIDSEIKDTKEYNTHNGMIKIGEDSYIELYNIKFYNFNRSVNNQIKFNIIANKKITNPSDSGIYISLYNSGENLIYMGAFEFDKTLENSVVNSSYLTIDNDIYLLASYAKIHKEIKESTPSSLKCSKSQTIEYSYTENAEFSFINDLLKNYKYTKTVNTTGSTLDTDASTKLQEEFNNLQSSGVTDLIQDNSSYSYTLNLENNALTVNKLSEYDTAKTIVSNRLISAGWTCE